MTVMSSPYDVSLSDMPLLRSLTAQAMRPNMLVVCSNADVQTAFEQVCGFLAPPFTVCLLPGPLDLPTGEKGTLFLHDIAALTQPQQRFLYDWLSTRGKGVQVVSMTGSQMLPLVETGRFHEGLFYRLNIISTVVGSA